MNGLAGWGPDHGEPPACRSALSHLQLQGSSALQGSELSFVSPPPHLTHFDLSLSFSLHLFLHCIENIFTELGVATRFGHLGQQPLTLHGNPV